MLTRCPHCRTLFRVTDAELGRAGGRVRCGACQGVFDASATLVDEEELALDTGAYQGLPVIGEPMKTPTEKQREAMRSEPDGRPAPREGSEEVVSDDDASERIVMTEADWAEFFADTGDDEEDAARDVPSIEDTGVEWVVLDPDAEEVSDEPEPRAGGDDFDLKAAAEAILVEESELSEELPWPDLAGDDTASAMTGLQADRAGDARPSVHRDGHEPTMHGQTRTPSAHDADHASRADALPGEQAAAMPDADGGTREPAGEDIAYGALTDSADREDAARPAERDGRHETGGASAAFEADDAGVAGPQTDARAPDHDRPASAEWDGTLTTDEEPTASGVGDAVASPQTDARSPDYDGPASAEWDGTLETDEEPTASGVDDAVALPEPAEHPPDEGTAIEAEGGAADADEAARLPDSDAGDGDADGPGEATLDGESDRVDEAARSDAIAEAAISAFASEIAKAEYAERASGETPAPEAPVPDEDRERASGPERPSAAATDTVEEVPGQSTEAAATRDADDEQPTAVATTTAGTASTPDEAATATLVPEVDWPPAATPPARPAWPWAVGALALLAVLALQWIHANRDAIAASPSLGPAVERAYAALGVTLHPAFELERYRFEQTRELSASDDADVLALTGTLGNAGTQPLPLPLIRITLFDRWDAPVAGAVLKPAEYLTGDTPARLAPGDDVDVAVAVRDPGSEAYGYRVDLCLPAAGGSLRCDDDRG